MTKDDDPQLLRDLRNLAADYEPDVAAIGRRIRNIEPAELVEPAPFIVPLGSLGPDPFGSAGPAGPTGTTGTTGPIAPTGTTESLRADPLEPPRLTDRLRLVPDVGSAPTVHRSRRALLLPAAAVLLLFGGLVLAGSLGGPDPDSSATAVPIATAVPTTPPTASRTTLDPSPSHSRSAAPPSADRTTTTPATASDPSTGATAAGPTTNRAKVTVVVAEPGTAVDLSRPPLVDWLAVGTRTDLKQVRDKAGATAGVLSLDQPGSATSADGPFSVSWTAGLPEQSHDDATGWLKADGSTGLTVTVSASSAPRTVVLYAGTQHLRGTIAFNGKGIDPARTGLGPASATPQGIVITASLPPTTGPTRIHLTGSADGPSAKVYLAAITLTP